MFRKFQPAVIIVLACSGALLPAVLGYAYLMADARERASAQNRALSAEMVSRAETVIDNSLSQLRRIAAIGGFACTPDTVAMLRRVQYASYTVKNVGPLDERGAFLCTELGERESAPISEPIPISDSVTLTVVEASSIARRTALIAYQPPDRPKVGVLVTPETLAVDLIPAGQRQETSAVLEFGSLANAAVVVASQESLAAAAPATGEIIEARVCSDRLPLCGIVTTPFALTWNTYDSMMIFVALGSVLCSVLATFGGGLLQRRATSLESRMRRALKAGAFVPFFQPIVNLRTGEVDGCEVLVRWKTAGGGHVAPSEFIECAERSGMILEITDRLIAQAPLDLKEVCLERPGFKIGFNLVDRHFDSFRIVNTIETCFDRAGLPVSHAAVEVTERRPLPNIQRAQVVIRKLQALGIKVALDDAGTGHSGLANLQQLGMNTIKIDKVFVDAITSEDAASPFIDSLVSIAGHLEMDVVAEGVETYEQLLFLREHGVQRAQGYLFGRPVPCNEFIALLRRAEDPRRNVEQGDEDLQALIAPLRVPHPTPLPGTRHRHPAVA
ncbi:EAL domain-containing protein [Methylobrevis pamukkalensis]|uniref:cyclic-guanylate-specific phosphodiesterase n=1 Tax=Methylobrevis pamukkalensis TaxID=1439726 RepID=A0A1E3GZN0_9HYPH|nr:EAL domain-containing protein [Methylobrevis pamukkalensis]ODN69016.1 Phytochrome-like protein cph2 [Methylobrevis pamukkalensis]